MKRFFFLIAFFLCLSGVLHLVKVFANPIDPNVMVAVILTGLFGLAYLVIGGWMFRAPERMLWPGAIVPLIGLLITLIGMKPNPDGYVIAFIVLDILVIAGCVYSLIRARSPIRRVS